MNRIAQPDAPVAAYAAAGGSGGKPVNTDSINPAGSKDPVAVPTSAALRDLIRAANLQAEKLCRHLLPNGRRQGPACVCGSWDGNAGQSIKVTTGGPKAGHWRDMRTGGGAGENMIEVWSHAKGITFDAAVIEVAAWLGSPDVSSTGASDVAAGPPRTSQEVMERRTTGTAVVIEKSPVAEAVVNLAVEAAASPMAGAVVSPLSEDSAAQSTEVTPSSVQLTDNRIDDATKASRVASRDLSQSSLGTTEPLTAAEKADYEKKVHRLKKIQATWFEAVHILAEIRDRRLYRDCYGTFEEFCRQELGMGKANANRQLQAGRVAEILATNVAKPECEAHVRPLLRLHDAAQQIRAFQQAVDQAKLKNQPLTTVFVDRAVREIEEAHRNQVEATPPTPSKSAVIKQISCALTSDLEKLSFPEIEAFEMACKEFKKRWLAEHLPEQSARQIKPTQPHPFII